MKAFLLATKEPYFMRRIDIKSSKLHCEFITDKLSGVVQGSLELVSNADIAMAQDWVATQQVSLMLVNSAGESFRVGKGTIESFQLGGAGCWLEVYLLTDPERLHFHLNSENGCEKERAAQEDISQGVPERSSN